MESPRSEKGNIIKDIRNISRLRKTKAINNRILRDIINCKPVSVGNFWSNSYIEYENNGDRSRTLSVKEYFNKIRTYLKDIINNLEKSDACKIQLTIANSFFLP